MCENRKENDFYLLNYIILQKRKKYSNVQSFYCFSERKIFLFRKKKIFLSFQKNFFCQKYILTRRNENHHHQQNLYNLFTSFPFFSLSLSSSFLKEEKKKYFVVVIPADYYFFLSFLNSFQLN